MTASNDTTPLVVDVTQDGATQLLTFYEDTERRAVEAEVEVTRLRRELDQTQGDLNALRVRYSDLVEGLRDAEKKHEETKWCLQQAQARVHSDICTDEDPVTCSLCSRWVAALNDSPTKDPVIPQPGGPNGFHTIDLKKFGLKEEP